QLRGPLFFGVANEMLDALSRIGRTPQTVILRLDRVPYIDSSGIHTLGAFVQQAKATQTRVILCDMRPSVVAELRRAEPPFAGAETADDFAEALERIDTRP
ncbi:MAG: STAS domain-containing protein, partial [Pseudodonghicola sp.]